MSILLRPHCFPLLSSVCLFVDSLIHSTYIHVLTYNLVGDIRYIQQITRLKEASTIKYFKNGVEVSEEERTTSSMLGGDRR